MSSAALLSLWKENQVRGAARNKSLDFRRWQTIGATTTTSPTRYR
jgi:hypothetical protein